MNKFYTVIVALCCFISFTSCQKEKFKKTSLELQLTVTDTYNYDDIQVRINSIEYDSSAGGSTYWKPFVLGDSTRNYPVNMHTLRHGNALALANQEMPAMLIKGIRIKFDSQGSVVKGGRVYPLVIPAELVQTGSYLPVNYTLSSGKQHALWIVWNTSNSIVFDAGSNSYIFRPDFRTFEPKYTGGIEGFLKPDAAMPYITVYTDTVANPNASVKFKETTIPYTAGYFKLVGVPAGKYNVKFGSANGGFTTKELKDVTVVNGQIRNVGTTTLQ